MGTLKNTFAWSKSRDEKFRECPRQYYYHYYGSWGGWDKSEDPRVREIYILKNLKSRHMWMGEVVHHTIENALKQYQKTHQLPANEFLDQMTERMRREFRESRNRTYQTSPGKALGLFEHEYQQRISDIQWVEIHENAKRCFANFTNVIFPQVSRAVPSEKWRLIETMQTFIFEDSLIYVKIDFAFEQDGVVTIVDWKTGKSEDVDNEIQLNCYGLFARDHFKVATEKVQAVVSNVNTGHQKMWHMIEAKMDFAKHYIRNSIGAMKARLQDAEKNIAIEASFPFTENEKTCQYCNFKRVCEKWK